MTSAAVHESAEPEQAVPGAAGKSSPAPAALDGLRAAAGNRGFGTYVRALARQPAGPAAPAAPAGAGTPGWAPAGAAGP